MSAGTDAHRERVRVREAYRWCGRRVLRARWSDTTRFSACLGGDVVEARGEQVDESGFVGGDYSI